MPVFKYGILIQGPFVEGYTEKVCQSYRKRFPHIPIVLSGWECDAALLKWRARLKEEYQIESIASKSPLYGGLHNRNLQMINTVAGLKYLKTQGIDIAIKTRADSYIENDFRNIFESVQEQFPLMVTHYLIRYRMILVESFTRIAVNYHASDMILIGHMDDLISYFDHPLAEPSTYTRQEYFLEPTAIKLTSPKYYEESPEQFFCLNFAKKIGWDVKHTMEDWHWMLKTLFYVCDDRTLGYRWYKNIWGWYGAKGMVVRNEFIFSLPKLFRTGISSLFAKNMTTKMWRSIYEDKKQVSFYQRLNFNGYMIYYNALLNICIVVFMALYFIRKPYRFIRFSKFAGSKFIEIMSV